MTKRVLSGCAPMRTALTVGWAKAAGTATRKTGTATRKTGTAAKKTGTAAKNPGTATKKQRKLNRIRVIDRTKVGGPTQPRIRKHSMGIEPLGISGVAISIRHHIYLNRTGTTKGNLGRTGSVGARPANRIWYAPRHPVNLPTLFAPTGPWRSQDQPGGVGVRRASRSNRVARIERSGCALTKASGRPLGMLDDVWRGRLRTGACPAAHFPAGPRAQSR